MKTKLISIICLLLLSSGTIIALIATTKPNKTERDAFTRKITNDMITAWDTITLKSKSYYIAGISDSIIFLSDPQSKNEVLKYTLKKKKIDRVNVKHLYVEKIEIPHYIINESNIYISDIANSTLWQSSIKESKSTYVSQHNLPYLDIIPISQKSNIARTFQDSTQEFVFIKTTDGKITTLKKPFKKQSNAMFRSDGMLSYDPTTSRLAFLYYYRNIYISLDTNLNIISQGNTIDSNAHAKVQTSAIASQQKVTLSGPSVVINKESCLSKNLLFVRSLLLSNNEPIESFEQSAVIDVYDITSNTYKLSFYIPNHLGYKIKQFKVSNENLVVLADKYLIIYKIHAI